MKSVRLIIVLGVYIFLSSCSKNDDTIVDEDKFFYNVIINDTLLRNTPFASYGDLDTNKKIIKFEYYNEQGYLREQIRLRNVDIRLGKAPLLFERRGLDEPIKPTAYFDLAYADGDAIGEGYDIFESDNFENYLFIDKISNDSSEIEGRFQFKLVLSNQSPPLTDLTKYSDTIVFTQGEFLAKKL